MMQEKVPGQNAFGYHQQPGFGRELAIEPDVPANLAAHAPTALVGDPLGHGARGHPAGLQQ